MNKTVILFLVICIISVHAFVKRETPTAEVTTENFLQHLSKQLGEGAEAAKKTLEEQFKSFDSKAVEKQMHDIIATIQNSAKNAFAPKGDAKA